MTGPASSSSSFSYQWPYDVFLNFRGEDTRNGFVGNLFNALRRKGIQIFMDDGELRKGDEITPSLFKAIEESRMAITVFSKNYACSTFCLDELVKILQCIKGNDRLVLPIFYDVEPSYVRHQKGNYEEALAMHQKNFKANEETIQNWKLALREAANLSGFHFNPRHEYEYQFIENIVNGILSKINRTLLHIAKYPIGLESRVSKINSLLQFESRDQVIMIGIYGIGGIGKSTIARAIFNSIPDQFEGLCFLDDIKESSSKLGLKEMQERMLSNILGVNIKVEDVNKGIPIIKRRLNQNKILLILDNVDKQEQLENLAGNCNWFGYGSRIIITTRDKHLLARHGVEKLYEVKELNNEESLELLRWNAFKKNQVDPSYTKVLNCVVEYAGGLPLALEVIGSHLFGKSIEEWKSVIDIYRRIPNEKVHKILKVSYDGLGEAEQEIFLDIASFFKGEDVTDVKEMVQYAHGFNPTYGIGVLMDKCLINIENGHVKMHDLIQDMGREIVRQESSNEPGKRSRLWNHEDIVHVLENNTGTDKISCIIQDNIFEDIEVNWDGKAFEKIKNLKILIFKKGRFSKSPKYLPNSLKVLKWPKYPSSCLPVDFHPRKLAILELRSSSLQFLEPIKKLANLDILDLSYSQFITQIPDLSGFPNLTTLHVNNCENLIEIHHSIGYTGKLIMLSIGECVKLRNFPHSIKLPSLKILHLWHSITLEKIEQILEEMENITQLDLSKTNFKLPCSIRELLMDYFGKTALLPNLEGTYIEGCDELRSAKQDNIKEVLSSMQCSKISRLKANISNELLSMYLNWFNNVTILDLSWNDFTVLPACIKECHFLRELNLNDCKHLREIRGIPPNITYLTAANCTLLSAESKSLLLSQKLHEAGNKRFVVPGASIPKWFDHCSSRPSISFWFRNNFPMISLCSVTPPLLLEKPTPQRFFIFMIINKKSMFHAVNVLTFGSGYNYEILSDHIACAYVLKWSAFNSKELNEALVQSGWNHVQVQMITASYYHDDEKEKYDDEWEDQVIYVKKIGMNVIRQESRMEDIQFINPYKRKERDDLNRVPSVGVSTWHQEYDNDSESLSSQASSDEFNQEYDNDSESLSSQASLDEFNQAILREDINDIEDKPIRHYEKLWKLQLPEKIKIFLWKAHHNWLAVRENLTAGEINIDDHTCPNCGAVGDSIMHNLVACPLAEVIWSMSPLMLRSKSLPQAYFSSWWEGLSSSLSYLENSMGMLEIAGFICWKIWKCRNESVFIRGSMGARQVISLVMQQVNEFQASLQTPRVLSSDSEEKDVNNSEYLTLPTCWQTSLDDESRTSLTLVDASDTISSNQDLQQPQNLNSRDLTWDPMEREYPVDMLEDRIDMNDQAGTIHDKDLQRQQSLTSTSREISKSSENVRIAKENDVVACKDNIDKEKHINTSEDPMEWEYQIACQLISNDKSTNKDESDEEMRSEQRRDPLLLRVCFNLFSCVALLCCSSSSLAAP